MYQGSSSHPKLPGWACDGGGRGWGLPAFPTRRDGGSQVMHSPASERGEQNHVSPLACLSLLRPQQDLVSSRCHVTPKLMEEHTWQDHRPLPDVLISCSYVIRAPSVARLGSGSGSEVKLVPAVPWVMEALLSGIRRTYMCAFATVGQAWASVGGRQLGRPPPARTCF